MIFASRFRAVSFLAGIRTTPVESLPEVIAVTDQERRMMVLMAEQTRAKEARNIGRYQELQAEIESLAEEMGWALNLVREGPVGKIGTGDY